MPRGETSVQFFNDSANVKPPSVRRRRHRLRLADNRIPPISDPIWAEWSQPIFKFLSEPRTWEALNKFQRQTWLTESVFRHCLAWLEDQGRVRAVLRGDDVRWAQNGVYVPYEGVSPSMSPDSVPPPEPSDPDRTDASVRSRRTLQGHPTPR